MYDRNESRHTLIRHNKFEYSMIEPPIWSYLELHREQITQALLYGCLTEVCVRKTCFDLLMRGYEVYVVNDAVGSIHQREKEVALESMRDAGASIITLSMIQYELDRKL